MTQIDESSKDKSMEAVEDTTAPEPQDSSETFQAIDSFIESLSPDELNYLRECLAEKDLKNEGEKEKTLDIHDFDEEV
jgi:hypothetical protein